MVGPARLLAALLLPAMVLAAGCRASNAGSRPSAPEQPGRSASPTAPAKSLGPNLATLTITSPSGTKAELHVRVEATEPAREQGLMNVAAMPEDEGDLFLWPDVAPNQDVLAPFWMKDTLIPLSIAFVSRDGRILEEQDMEAMSQALHVPRSPYRFAIEANQGWFVRHGMPSGSVVTLPALALPTGTPLPLPPGIPPPPPPPTLPSR